MLKRIWAGLFCLIACGDGDPTVGISCAELSVSACGHGNSCQLISADGGTIRCGEERVGLRGCSLLSVEECEQDARCQTIDGRAFDEDRMCTSPSEPKGCQERGLSCPPTILYARDAESKSYEFVSGCVPLGWARFQPVLAPQQDWPSCELRAGECEARELDVCHLDRRCAAIGARRIDEARHCLGDGVTLQCVASPQICTDALVVARDPQGQRWWFGNGCFPPGFQSADSDGAVNWPLCNPPPPPTSKP